MSRILALMLVAGCAATHGGVQIGDESVAVDTPCDVADRDVGLDEAVFATGESAADLLAALPLQAAASPTWDDGTVADVTVDLGWDQGPILYRVFTPIRDGATCPSPAVVLGLAGHVASSDGQVDEDVATTELRFGPDEGSSVDDYVPADEIGGTLDPEALVDPLLDGAFTAELEVLVQLTAGQASHGALVAVGCPAVVADQGHPAPPCTPVEQDVASW